MRLYFIFLALTLLSYVHSEQTLPFPERPEGFSIGAPNPVLHIEAFWDVSCSDCKESKPFLMKVLNDYNIKTSSLIKLTIHMYSTLSHFNAFLFVKGFKAIERVLHDEQDLWNYVDLILDHQEEFYMGATRNMTQKEIAQKLTNLVTTNPNFTHYNATYFHNSLYDPVIEAKALLNYQLGCQANVIETPTYLANGVAIRGAELYEEEEWRKLISQFVKGKQDSLRETKEINEDPKAKKNKVSSRSNS